MSVEPSSPPASPKAGDADAGGMDGQTAQSKRL